MGVQMAKGHLLITPPVRSKNDDENPARPSCFRELTIADAAILLSGIQLAIMAGYLLHLTSSYDAPVYPAQYHRVNVSLVVVPVMIAVVMLTVFGIVGKRLWMIVPNLLTQLGFVAVFIAAAVNLGQAVSNFQVPDQQDVTNGSYKEAQERLYALKIYMALSILALILSILSLVVIVLCFIRVYKTRNEARGAGKNENGY